MGKYALLIGVETYGEGLQSLPAAPKDVAALREVLLNPEMGDFNEAKPLINPTQPAMAREIELWFQDRQPEDLVLLFFSGHGVKDDRRDLYFAAANTEKQRDRLVRSTATPARFLHDCIRGCKAKQQVLILDCCFSGAFGDLVGKDDGEIPLKEQLGAEGRVVLTSTSAVDYSFEEKGADLSIYTRYLVEGIATGAADEDGDGVITAEELHRYAGRKVEETSPAMSPQILIPQGEGYRIRLARSPQDDPKLKYRKEVEQRAVAAEFTIPARRLLSRLQAELGLSEAEADAIETEVLKPHREYQRKHQEYQETLEECLDKESPLSPRTIQDLKDYRAHLQLKPEDMAALERSALNGQNLAAYTADLERQQQEAVQRRQQEREAAERRRKEAEAERQRQAEAQRQREEAERKRQAEAAAQDDLSSEKGIDYTRLRDLLKAGKWRDADRETYKVMIRAVGKESGKWFDEDELLNFPCTDLRTIDRLWVKYSNGKFGFSVQKKIYVECGAKLDGQYPGGKIWEEFCDRVGWRRKDGGGRKDGNYLSIFDLQGNPSISPAGEFPLNEWFWVVGCWYGGGRGWFLFSRIKTCKL